MSLNERILAARAALAEKQSALGEIVKSADAEVSVIAEATKGVEAAQAELAQLEAAEAAISKSVGGQSAAIVKGGDKSKGMSDEAKVDTLVKSATAMVVAHASHRPVEAVVAEAYGDESVVKDVVAVTKAANANAVNPAMSNAAGWAQELTRQAYGAFIDLLRDRSVIPAVPFGQRYTFDGYASIYLPVRSAGKGVAGEFRAEGAPIPVKQLGFSSKTLTPKSLGVISHFTNEMLERSTPNLEQIVRASMIEDTAESLDSHFLGATAASATAPAGLQALALAADKNAAQPGNDADKIHADLTAMVIRLAKHKLGASGVWIMNPAQFRVLQFARNAMGVALYPETGANNLMGYPVIISTNVPEGVVFLVDASQLGFAGGNPRFAVSTETVLHESNPALPLADNAATPVAANPVRSLFQTNCTALRCIWELDWATMRDGSIQVLTGVQW